MNLKEKEIESILNEMVNCIHERNILKIELTTIEKKHKFRFADQLLEKYNEIVFRKFKNITKKYTWEEIEKTDLELTKEKFKDQSSFKCALNEFSYYRPFMVEIYQKSKEFNE